MDFADKLQALAATDRRPSVKSLTFLSDLSREDRDALRAGWTSIAPDRRRAVARTLVDLAEDNIELDFRNAYQVLLDDPEEAVRLAAIDGLWEDESPAVLGRLLALIAEDQAATVRAAAVGALGRFTYLAELGKLRDDRKAALRGRLLAVVRNPTEHPDVQRRAIESLGYLSGDDEVSAEIRAGSAGPGKLPISAICAMGRSMDARWAPTLLRELQSAAPEMRYEAARAVGELGDAAHVPALLDLLTDSDVEVRQAAIWALGQLGGRQAAVALLKFRDTDNPAIRDAVEDALSELRYTADPLSLI